MSGLMVVFMFIAITYIRPLLNERNTVRSIAVTFQQNEVALVQALRDEFKDDLKRWNAELDPETVVIRFKAPDVLFASGEADITPQFKAILNDFFPRYLRVLDRFRDSIEEVRIEGHTSQGWKDAPPDVAYFNNMALSQARTLTVLQHVLKLPAAAPYREWATHHITANGLSSSRPIRDADGHPVAELSRRVEIRVRTNAKQEIIRILETVGQ
jgi:outer membrane protein OmpA-like peptidoglycan-associated protein